ncbi:hypothetical protein FOZG_15867 [Fusarium oxysporum Fo47]|uniref:DUF6594 domain-containing protein n=1 Tax=Fusarium oxysporum Fo47 TaxID=660027 RepID=W9JL59_FUSOX|nr:hypothetical protein FOZG_15867 [Fusarium oxysporum Fo47]
MASPNVLPMDQLHPGQGQSWSKTFGNGSIEKYHRLANIMSQDKHFAIFRRFDDINLAVLLALQAEIVDLQYQLQVQSQKDNSGQGQRDLLIKLQPKLTEYNNLILQLSELSQLQFPRTSQLETLQDWLTDPKGGANFLTKTGTPELYTWKPKDPSQYVSLHKPAEDSDPFTNFVKEVLTFIFHRLCGERLNAARVVDVESGLASYSDSSLVRASNLFTVIVSSALPVLTIFALNSLETTAQRIGLTVVFTVLFAVILELFTNAKRVEIFAATATFAAVEVVFIGSALNSNYLLKVMGSRVGLGGILVGEDEATEHVFPHDPTTRQTRYATLPATDCLMGPRTGQAYSFEVTALPELEFPLGCDIFVPRRRVTIPDGTTKVESLVSADLSQVENASDEKFESDMEKMGDMGIIKDVVGFATKFEDTSPTLCDAPVEFKTVTTHQDAVEVDDIYTDGTDDVSVFYFHYHSNSSSSHFFNACDGLVAELSRSVEAETRLSYPAVKDE